MMLTATKNESLLATRTRRVVERRSDRSAASLPAAVLVGLMVVALAGCSSTSDAPRTADASTSTAPVVREPAEILALDLDDSGELASLELEADRPLVWTSFRNPEGDLVVELPNSVPLPSLVDMAPAGGLIESVDVEQIEDSERPLTRLTVATREPSEHSLVGDGDRLRLQLLPIDSAQKVTLAYEPVEEEATEPPRVEPVEVADLDPVSPAPEAPTVVAPPIAEQRGVPQTYGTPESPQRGPSPSGAVASALLGVDVLEEGASTVVQIEGDGEFVYSTFRLENPERFVIDLEGVVNGSATSAVTVRSDRVERIRVGQFKPRPAPVSRVVFDLRETTVPSIVPVAEGLTVLFGDATTAVAAVAPASVEPVEQPPVETTPEPVTPEPVVVADLDETAPQPSTDEPAPAPVDDPFAVEPEPVAEVAPADPIVDAVAQAPPPVQMYQQTPDPLPAGEAVTFAGNGEPANVALYEAQDVQLDDADIRRERLLDSFGELVVNREDREYVGEPITMTLRDADLVETLRSFAKISDLNFVIQPGVRGSVTVELNSVPWDQALEQILKINNLGMDIDGTIVRIAPRSVLSDEAEQARRLREARQQSVPLRTVIRALSYARAAEVASLLRNRTGAILSSRGTVQIDSRTNTLIIRELPDTIDTVLAVIDNLDRPEAQVTIEARIIEATKNFSRSLGIDWDFDYEGTPENGNTTGLVFPNSVETDGGVGLLTGGANGFLNLTLGNILDTFNLNARIQAAEAEGLVNVVSAPRITTINNNQATIQSGLQIPIQTVSDRTVSVQFVNATLNLTVRPQVTAEGTVLLDINVAKRTPQLALAVVGATNAPIATREAQTRLIVRDGGTAVIGGIYEVTSNQNQDRVPGLANVPILGYLFKNRNRSDSNEELMIFITPRIVQL